MKKCYPVVLIPESQGFTVYVPDFDVNTQGDSLAEAMEMARDVIGMMGIDMEDDKKVIPEPSLLSEVNVSDNDILTLVDVDFAEYRRKNAIKVVKKNCTLPSWLCYEAEKANLNFSQVLQVALKRELKISE